MPSFPVIAEWTSDPTRGSLSLGSIGDYNPEYYVYMDLEYREPNKQCPLMKLRLIPATINAEGERRRQVDSSISLVFGASNLSSSRLVTDTRRSCPPTEITAATQGEIRRIKNCAPKNHQHDGVMKLTVNARPVLLIPRQPAPLASEPLQLFKELSFAKEFSLYAVYPRVVEYDLYRFCNAVGSSNVAIPPNLNTGTHISRWKPNDSDWNKIMDNTPSGRSISLKSPNVDDGKVLNPDSSKSECIQSSTAAAPNQAAAAHVVGDKPAQQPKDLTHSHQQGALFLSKSASAARSRVMSKALARQRSRLVFGHEAGANMNSDGTSPTSKPKEVREDQALGRDTPQRGKKRSLSVDTESSIGAASTANRPADTAQLAGAKLDRQALSNAERLAFLRKKARDSIGAMTAKKRARFEDEDIEATADVFLGKLREELESRWAPPRSSRASPPPPYAAASHGPDDTCEIVKPGDRPANTQPFLARNAATCGEAVVSKQAVAKAINITTVLNGPPYSTADVIRAIKVHRPAQEALFAKNKLLALWRRWTAWVLREHETEPTVVGPLLWKAFRAASGENMGDFAEAIVAVLEVLFL